MWGDRVRLRRWKAQYKLFEKASQFAEERGIGPQEIPQKALFPLLERATLEDPEDDAMMDRWANLLVASADPAHDVPLGFSEILSQLGPREAQFLDTIYERCTELPREEWWARGVTFTAIAEGTPEVRAAAQLVIESLYRLGLAAAPTTGTTGSGGIYEKQNKFQGSPWTPMSCLTELGYAFVSACRSPQDVKIPPPPAPSDQATSQAQ